MSAFMVSKAHIDYLITAGLTYSRYGPLYWYVPSTRAVQRKQELTFQTADQVGQMLWATNRDSVNHRYDEEKLEEIYHYHQAKTKLEFVQIFKAIDCYEYQSCEHPEWEASEAKTFCEVLRFAVIYALPRYEEAKWEIVEEEAQ